MSVRRHRLVRGCWSIEMALVIDLLESPLSGRYGVFLRGSGPEMKKGSVGVQMTGNCALGVPEPAVGYLEDRPKSTLIQASPI